MISLEQGREALCYAHSCNRANILLDLHSEMERINWLTIVGEEWTGTDNLSMLRKSFKQTLGTKGPLPEMMTPEEQLFYDSLSSEVTVYRGCDFFDKTLGGGLYGMSWTPNLEIAKKFPWLNRYVAEYPVVYRAQVKKNRILAVKLDRGEEEVITFGPYKNLKYMRIPRRFPLPIDLEGEAFSPEVWKHIVEWGSGIHTDFVPFGALTETLAWM